MNALIGVTLCFLLGIMLRTEGVSALLWTPLGFVSGVFAAAQITLPLLMDLPRAFRLVSSGHMRVEVYGRLLKAPIFWVAVPLVACGLWPSGAEAVFANHSFMLGAALGALAVVLSTFSAKNRSHLVAYFDRGYQAFYITPLTQEDSKQLVAGPIGSPNRDKEKLASAHNSSNVTNTNAAPRWYILRDGIETGPFTPDELKAKAASGDIRHDTFVRKPPNVWSRADGFHFLMSQKQGAHRLPRKHLAIASSDRSGRALGIASFLVFAVVATLWRQFVTSNAARNFDLGLCGIFTLASVGMAIATGIATAITGRHPFQKASSKPRTDQAGDATTPASAVPIPERSATTDVRFATADVLGKFGGNASAASASAMALNPTAIKDGPIDNSVGKSPLGDVAQSAHSSSNSPAPMHLPSIRGGIWLSRPWLAVVVAIAFVVGVYAVVEWRKTETIKQQMELDRWQREDAERERLRQQEAAERERVWQMEQDRWQREDDEMRRRWLMEDLEFERQQGEDERARRENRGVGWFGPPHAPKGVKGLKPLKGLTPVARPGYVFPVGLEVTLFDSTGAAVAYSAADKTIFLWSGRPVAYLANDSKGGLHIYGFNGEHLGWLVGGVVRDHHGYAAGAVKGALVGITELEPPKGLAELTPLKSLEKLPPLRPLFVRDWSTTPLRQLLASGRD